ncbi:MAG: hypothetical protein IRZ09_02290 [Variibacter sp.]|nr:hypothetical protein [Variibacter sp.]
MIGYRIGGLHVWSEFEFPNLAPIEKTVREPADVVVRFCDEVGAPRDPRFQNALIAAGEEDFLFRPGPCLSFRIQAGRDIAIARGPGATDDEVRVYLTGSVWGALCHQRRLVPLHCSAVACKGRTFGFAGPSGAGKSTLAAALARRGHAHVCDDVCVFDAADGAPRVNPMPKDLKLWRDAAEALGYARGPRVLGDLEKYYVPLPTPAADGPFEMAALYLLSDAGAAPAIARVQGGARLRDLLASIYRSEWLNLIRPPAEVFVQVAALARRLKIFRFSRPRTMARFEEGLALLEAHMAEVAEGGEGS